MKKKLTILAVFIISVICLFSIYIKNTYSIFTTTASTELSFNFIAEPTYTYFFQLPPDWDGTEVWSYMWDDTTKDSNNNATIFNAKYPGEKLKCVDNVRKIYSYTIPTETYHAYGKNPYTNIIFSDGSISDKQTADVEIDDNINGEIFAPELYKPTNSNEIRVICKGCTPCYIYIWDDNLVNERSWPGRLIGSSDRDNSYISADTYYTTFDRVKYPNMIFNNGNGGTLQTQDLKTPTMQDLTCVITGNKTSHWERRYYFGSWHTYSNWIKTEYTKWHSNDYQEFLKPVPEIF